MSDIIYQLDYTEVYLEDLQKHKKSGQKKVLIKIKSLIDEIEVHPTRGKGKPEQLKGYGERFVYSRRIDQKHRLVYEIFEEEKKIDILSSFGHYDDR